eukprot:GILI01003072.1.p1 GENE.GILI01003072.1~~GILI01003072.1.p1  ORF type:complete len:1561 (+),score=396.92 GILI01003072.1:96-4685(+)
MTKIQADYDRVTNDTRRMEELIREFPFLAKKKWSQQDKAFFNSHINFYQFDFEQARKEYFLLRGGDENGMGDKADTESGKSSGSQLKASSGSMDTPPLTTDSSTEVPAMQPHHQHHQSFSSPTHPNNKGARGGYQSQRAKVVLPKVSHPIKDSRSFQPKEWDQLGAATDDAERPFGRVRYPTKIPGKITTAPTEQDDATEDATGKPKLPASADVGRGYNNCFAHVTNLWPQHEERKGLLSRIIRQMLLAYGLGGKEAVTAHGPLKRYMGRHQSALAYGSQSNTVIFHAMAAQAANENTAYARRIGANFGKLAPTGTQGIEGASLTSSQALSFEGSGSMTPRQHQSGNKRAPLTRPGRELHFTSCFEVYLRPEDDDRIKFYGRNRENLSLEPQTQAKEAEVLDPLAPPMLPSPPAPQMMLKRVPATAVTAKPKSLKPPIEREWATTHAFLQHVLHIVENAFDIMAPNGYYHLNVVNSDSVIIPPTQTELIEQLQRERDENPSTQLLKELPKEIEDRLQRHSTLRGSRSARKALLRLYNAISPVVALPKAQSTSASHNLDRFVDPPTPTVEEVLDLIQGVQADEIRKRKQKAVKPSAAAAANSPVPPAVMKIPMMGTLEGATHTSPEKKSSPLKTEQAAVDGNQSAASPEGLLFRSFDSNNAEDALATTVTSLLSACDEEVDLAAEFDAELNKIKTDASALAELQILMPATTRFGYQRAIAHRDIVLASPNALDSVRQQLQSIISRVGLTQEEAAKMTPEAIQAWESLGNLILLNEALICEVDQTRLPEQEYFTEYSREKRRLKERYESQQRNQAAGLPTSSNIHQPTSQLQQQQTRGLPHHVDPAIKSALSANLAGQIPAAHIRRNLGKFVSSLVAISDYFSYSSACPASVQPLPIHPLRLIQGNAPPEGGNSLLGPQQNVVVPVASILRQHAIVVATFKLCVPVEALLERDDRLSFSRDIADVLGVLIQEEKVFCDLDVKGDVVNQLMFIDYAGCICYHDPQFQNALMAEVTFHMSFLKRTSWPKYLLARVGTTSPTAVGWMHQSAAKAIVALQQRLIVLDQSGFFVCKRGSEPIFQNYCTNARGAAIASAGSLGETALLTSIRVTEVVSVHGADYDDLMMGVGTIGTSRFDPQTSSQSGVLTTNPAAPQLSKYGAGNTIVGPGQRQAAHANGPHRANFPSAQTTADALAAYQALMAGQFSQQLVAVPQFAPQQQQVAYQMIPQQQFLYQAPAPSSVMPPTAAALAAPAGDLQAQQQQQMLQFLQQQQALFGAPSATSATPHQQAPSDTPRSNTNQLGSSIDSNPADKKASTSLPQPSNVSFGDSATAASAQQARGVAPPTPTASVRSAPSVDQSPFGVVGAAGVQQQDAALANLQMVYGAGGANMFGGLQTQTHPLFPNPIEAPPMATAVAPQQLQHQLMQQQQLQHQLMMQQPQQQQFIPQQQIQYAQPQYIVQQPQQFLGAAAPMYSPYGAAVPMAAYQQQQMVLPAGAQYIQQQPIQMYAPQQAAPQYVAYGAPMVQAPQQAFYY